VIEPGDGACGIADDGGERCGPGDHVETGGGSELRETLAHFDGITSEQCVLRVRER
jgi:hypothetical protein